MVFFLEREVGLILLALIFASLVCANDVIDELPSKGTCRPSEDKSQPIQDCDLETAPHAKYDQEDDIPDKPELLQSTHRICEYNTRCGFLKYDANTRQPREPFVKYCRCPKGLACIRFGENKKNHFFYYKCAVLVGVETAWDIGMSYLVEDIFWDGSETIREKIDERLHNPSKGLHMDTEIFKEKLEELARTKSK